MDASSEPRWIHVHTRYVRDAMQIRSRYVSWARSICPAAQGAEGAPPLRYLFVTRVGRHVWSTLKGTAGNQLDQDVLHHPVFGRVPPALLARERLRAGALRAREGAEEDEHEDGKLDLPEDVLVRGGVKRHRSRRTSHPRRKDCG